MIWMILQRGHGRFRFVRAEQPCWKGEIIIPLWRWFVCLGWQKWVDCLRCSDCGKPYRNFPLDVVLTDEQWALISDRPNGVLCAACIVERAAKVPGVTVAKMVLE